MVVSCDDVSSKVHRKLQREVSHDMNITVVDALDASCNVEKSRQRILTVESIFLVLKRQSS